MFSWKPCRKERSAMSSAEMFEEAKRVKEEANYAFREGKWAESNFILDDVFTCVSSKLFDAFLPFYALNGFQFVFVLSCILYLTILDSPLPSSLLCFSRLLFFVLRLYSLLVSSSLFSSSLLRSPSLFSSSFSSLFSSLFSSFLLF